VGLTVTDEQSARQSIIERAMNCRSEAAKAMHEAQQARDSVLRESHLLFARGWTKLADYYESHKHTTLKSPFFLLPDEAPPRVALAAVRVQNDR
jgi:hypothetical protein